MIGTLAILAATVNGFIVTPAEFGFACHHVRADAALHAAQPDYRQPGESPSAAAERLLFQLGVERTVREKVIQAWAAEMQVGKVLAPDALSPAPSITIGGVAQPIPIGPAKAPDWALFERAVDEMEAGLKRKLGHHAFETELEARCRRATIQGFADLQPTIRLMLHQ